MKEKISRISRGLIDTEQPQVGITPSVIESVISCENIYKAELRVTGEDRYFLRGLIYTVNLRVKPASPYFAGSDVYIAYSVDTSRLVPGDEIKGEFQLVTCAGEFTVPYSFVLNNFSFLFSFIFLFFYLYYCFFFFFFYLIFFT